MSILQNRNRVATVIAVFFHAIGFAGMLTEYKDLFIAATPFNLLLMLVLLLYTQQKINGPFLLFSLICFCVGFGAEAAGINYGLLFGEYTYGKVLGFSFKGVPLLIGVNWFIIIYCSGITVNMLLERLSVRLSEATGAPSPAIQFFSVMSDGAMLALFFDWVMEPAAVKLGYWKWLGDGEIPTYNYLCWFVISALLTAVFSFLKFKKHNVFAVNLLLIMMMFFMLIRTFL